MDILDFFASYRKEWWLTQLKTCEWRAAKLLVELIEQDTFHQVLGEGSLYLLVKGVRSSLSLPWRRGTASTIRQRARGSGLCIHRPGTAAAAMRAG